MLNVWPLVLAPLESKGVKTALIASSCFSVILHECTVFIFFDFVCRQKLAEIPSRILLPAISSCFSRLCETRDFASIEPLLNILAESFPKGGQFSADLTRLFLSMFDFRCVADGVDEERVSQVEDYVINALCSIVLKCSETTFRPFYHKLYDWGVIASKEQSKKDRIITYYR